jgi:hypothetical protein
VAILIDSLQSYTGYERKRVVHMYDVLNELLTECRIGGVMIDDWTTSRIIATHATPNPTTHTPYRSQRIV